MNKNGFTLLELIITIAITGIVVSLAAPNFSSLVDDNVTSTQTNYFATAINVARSESIKRNSRVVVCKRTLKQCDDGAEWEDGWIIFADTDNDKQVDPGEEISFIDALRSNYTLRADSADIDWISFDPDGTARSSKVGAFSGVTFALCSPDSNEADARTISMNTVGRTQISKGVTTTCP